MSGPLERASKSIIIPTMVQTSLDILNQFSSLTCFYDTQWVPEYDRMTLPICMFHLKSMHEIGKSTVSTKRIILYEPQSDNNTKDMANQVRPSVLRAIADNNVREPRQYTADVIIPFGPIGRYLRDYSSLLGSLLGMFMAELDDHNVIQTIQGYAVSFTDMAAEMVSTADKLANLNGVTYINKNSLDAMWERSHFLCMKMWTGYDYRYVMITNVDVEKKAVEDDVFRGSIQFQEMPVLCVNRPVGASISGVRSKAISAISAVEKGISTVLKTVTGVEDATTVKK
jgi:hypothetical protein